MGIFPIFSNKLSRHSVSERITSFWQLQSYCSVITFRQSYIKFIKCVEMG
jgi:hypothetical protein